MTYRKDDFYMPKYKSEFVDYLVEHKGWKKWKLRKKTLAELCRIYCDERRKNRVKSTQVDSETISKPVIQKDSSKEGGDNSGNGPKS